VTSVKLSATRRHDLKLKAKGPMGHTLLTNPAPVDVVLTIGGTRYCMRFGTTPASKFKADAGFQAKAAPPPVACPP
jgi:hypothetical protein